MIGIHNVNETFLKLLLHDAKSIMSTTSVAKAEASFMELVIQYRLDHVDNRPLDDSIADRRNAQWSRLVRSSRFGNMNATNRTRAIGLVFDLFGELSCFHEQMLLERFAALPIDTRGFLLRGHLAGGRE